MRRGGQEGVNPPEERSEASSKGAKARWRHAILMGGGRESEPGDEEMKRRPRQVFDHKLKQPHLLLPHSAKSCNLPEQTLNLGTATYDFLFSFPE